jgi:hypothetical protein
MVKIQEMTDKLRIATLVEGRRAWSAWKVPIVAIAMDYKNGFRLRDVRSDEARFLF